MQEGGEKDQDNLSDISGIQKKNYQKNNSVQKNINDTLNSIGSLTGSDNNNKLQNTTTEKKDKKADNK